MDVQDNIGNKKANNRKRRLAQLKPVIVESLRKAFPQNREVADNLSAIFDLLAGQVFSAPDDKTRKLGIAFLDEATRDVRSCKLLYSKKLYPHAVYHLQQAVEKAIKGYVLLEGFYKADELKEISTHQSPLVILKAVLERTGIKSLAQKLDDKTLITKISDAESTITSEEKRIEIAKTSPSEIKRLLSRIEEYREMTAQIKQETAGTLTNISLGPMPMSLFQTVSALVAIMILAIITFPHWSYTRYPDAKMTPRDYTDQLGIVHETKRILPILETEIGNLEGIYKK